ISACKVSQSNSFIVAGHFMNGFHVYAYSYTYTFRRERLNRMGRSLGIEKSVLKNRMTMHTKKANPNIEVINGTSRPCSSGKKILPKNTRKKTIKPIPSDPNKAAPPRISVDALDTSRQASSIVLTSPCTIPGARSIGASRAGRSSYQCWCCG